MHMKNIYFIPFLLGLFQAGVSLTQQPVRLLIIPGSIRTESTGHKIASVIKEIAAQRSVQADIAHLSEYEMPHAFSTHDAHAIEDTASSRWQEAISAADALIILVPNYNQGPSGIIINALNAAGKTLAHKVVFVIGYSGGYDGGQGPVLSIEKLLKNMQAQVLDNKGLFITFADNALTGNPAQFKKEAYTQEVIQVITLIKDTIAS